MRPTLRIFLAALALGAVAWSVFAYVRFRDEMAALVARVRPLSTSPHTQGALASLRSEPNLAQARGRLARALVAEALEVKPGSAEAQRAALARLELAHDLALEALAKEPVNWEAHLALGASTYLTWSLEQDNRLFVEARAWELPLKRALELAPARPEAARFLSLAYMEVWSVLPAWKQEEARALLGKSFADPGTFERLIGPWLAVAGGLEPALALVPDEPYAWQRLRQVFFERQDWAGYARASNELDRVLGERLAAAVSAAEEQLAAGELASARAALLAVLRQLPVDGRFAPTFARVMERLPPGPLDATSDPALSAWLAWAAALAPSGASPLPATAVGRLARAAGETEPHRQALFALLADDLATAERLEFEAPHWPGDWAPYWITKARARARQGDLAAARHALAQTPTSARGSVAFLAAEAAITRAEPGAAGAAEADHLLAAASADRWPAAAWQRSLRRASIEMLTARAAKAFTLAVLEAPADGTALTFELDGTGLGTFVLPGSGAVLTVPANLRPGTHRLTVMGAHGDFAPGELTLAP